MPASFPLTTDKKHVLRCHPVIHHYRAMADDPLRLLAFRKAIEAAVRPGDVVADIGCGLGTYAIYAARAGSRRVLAVEEGPVRQVAAEIIRQNGCADRVELLAGRSTDVPVPERAQLVIFEDHVASLLSPRLLEVMNDIQSRWLAPGGRVLPSSARLVVSAVEDPSAHQDVDRFIHLRDQVVGVDLSSTRKLAFSTPIAKRLSPAALLSQPSVVKTYDFQVPVPAELRWQADVAAQRGGVVHGLLLWFALEVGTAWLETGPLAPPCAWNQTFLPFEAPLEVHEGEPMSLQLRWAPFGQASVWHWGAQTSRYATAGDSFATVPFEPDKIRASSPTYVPEESETRQLERFILSQVDGKRNLAAIAAALKAAFPTRDFTEEVALGYVGAFLTRSERIASAL